MGYVERQEYNNVITVKLVIPTECNAHCCFCYMKDYKVEMCYDKDSFLNQFMSSLSFIIDAIGDKNPISLDITGNEPTYDTALLKEVLCKLNEFNIKNKVLRTTITTNGYNLKEVIPYFKGVIDYVNISVHDFRIAERQCIMRWQSFSDEYYTELVSMLKTIGIKTSAICVIHKCIDNFRDWRDAFIEWCKRVGFIGLRLRCDVFWSEKILFEQYMNDCMDDDNFTVITHENTSDSHWCRLRRIDGFRVFFLQGVLDTSLLTKGIEYVIADDGCLYCDFYKRTKIQDYQYEIGRIYDCVSED